MKIYLNGEVHNVPDSCTAAQLVELLGLRGRRIAVEVNLEILPRSGYDSYILKAEDKVEIVHAIGGG